MGKIEKINNIQPKRGTGLSSQKSNTMSKPKVAILGAGKIGRFHAKEFNCASCEVAAILGRTKESSERKAKDLRNLGIHVRSYHTLTELLKKEKIDAVSICTPPELHSTHVRKCLEYGLHILCEKPFVLDSKYKNYKIACELLKIAREKNKVLTVNTQWPAVLDKLPIDKSKLHSFSMLMAPPRLKGMVLIKEVLPHMNSMLIRLSPDGVLSKIKFTKLDGGGLEIRFDYTRKSGVCKVKYIIKPKEDAPTKVSFSINGEEFHREVGKGYKQRLIHKGRAIEIDPFRDSIRKFVSSLSGGECLIKEEEILKNVKMQDEIVEKIVNVLK